jgi:hypothetical protein
MHATECRQTGPTRQLLLLGGVSILTSLSGCVPAGSPSSYNVATFTANVTGLSRAEGTLAGQTNGDGSACFWIGEGTNRFFLVWPQGYSAKGGTLGIVDQAGRMRATTGKRVAVGGHRDDRAGVSVQGCTGVGEPWLVGEVIELDN